MEILRENVEGDFRVVGKRCDRCGNEARACRSLKDEFAMYEFVRIDVNAGYGADYFADGDSWAADLCERCVLELIGPFLRLVCSYEDRELQRAIAEGFPACSDWMEGLREAVVERRQKPLQFRMY